MQTTCGKVPFLRSDLVLTLTLIWPWPWCVTCSHTQESRVEISHFITFCTWPWPWAWPNDVDTQTWPRYGHDIFLKMTHYRFCWVISTFGKHPTSVGICSNVFSIWSGRLSIRARCFRTWITFPVRVCFSVGCIKEPDSPVPHLIPDFRSKQKKNTPKHSMYFFPSYDCEKVRVLLLNISRDL